MNRLHVWPWVTAVARHLPWLSFLLIAALLLGHAPQPAAEAQTPPARRVNIAPFSGTEEWAQTAVFWFGVNDHYSQIPGRNYVDARLGYSNNNLLLRLTVIDYYLWFDTNPTPGADLTAYDAIALYLDTGLDRAAAPQADDYLFLFQARHGRPHTDYHREARGSGSGWNYNWNGEWNSQSSMDWSNNGPNDNGGHIDFGWTGIYIIPWSVFGLSGPPAVGTVWGMGLELFDRDAQPPAGGVAPQTWPLALNRGAPASWGELHFGEAVYTPETTAVTGQTTLRAATPTDNSVADTWTGGGGLCASGHMGGSEINHGSDINLFTGSEIRATHFPCFNRTYLRFDLSAIPPGKTIIAAELSLNLWSHAGETPDLAERSWVSLHSIKDPWQEMGLHWNNAPLAYENVAATWVNPYSGDRDQPVWPGDRYTWDASKAVAEAYAAGQPVSLALYGSDTEEHSSKYFYSSESNAGTSPTDGRGRPSLTVTWGDVTPVAAISKTAVPPWGSNGDQIVFTLRISGSGSALSLVDNVPAGLTVVSVGTGLTESNGQITWEDTPAAGQVVTLQYTAQVTAVAPTALSGTAVLYEGEDSTLVAAATTTIIANPEQLFLPLLRR